MFRRTFHVGQVISSCQLNFSLNGKFKVLTNSFSTSKTTSWTKKGIEESSSSFTLKLHGTSILSLRKIQTPNFNISAPSPFLSSRSFSTKSEKKEEKKPKPMSEAKIQKMEKVRGYLQELGRKKPIRRSMARSQQLEERKKNPIPNDTVLLYRSSNELDKVDAIWGIRRPRETLPPGSITSPYNKPKVHKEKPKKGKRQQAINQMDEESTEEQKPEPPPRISHTEVKAMLDSKQPVILIDLREPLLVENESSINGAYSFPIARRGSKPIKERALFLHDALKLSPEQFKMKYHVPILNLEDNIIFCSSIGIRSEETARYAINLGFKNSKSLYGGVRLWNKYYCPPKEKKK